MYQHHTINRLLLAIGFITLNACSMAGYQQIETLSSPRYQKGTPIMSEMKVMCRAQVIIEPKDGHPPLDFMVTYDRIWDVTLYPTSPRRPRKYNPKWCQNGLSTQIITNIGGGLFTKLDSEYKGDTRQRYNEDPSKGAVRYWEFPSVEIDGLNYRATMVSFYPMIIKGHKLPTGSNFKNGKYINSPHVKKETILINGREWQHYEYEFIVGRDIPEHGEYKAGHRSVDELYTTKIGNYTFAMLGDYASDLVTNAPEWLDSRQAYLRNWLKSFEFGSVSQISK